MLEAPGQAATAQTDARIVYIGSYGRSGSTLLGRMLAEAPATICVGETRYVWSRGFLDDVDCGCGVPFRLCPFWGAVAQEAFGGWDGVDVVRLAEVDRLLNRLRTLPFHLAPRFAPRLRRMIDEYVAALRELYQAIALVSGASTIVEISKDPTFACLLARLPGYEVRVVHLVRDSRAVAYSWTRRRREPSPIAGRNFMPQFSPCETATKWMAFNTGLRMLRTAGLAHTTVTYEEFMSDPPGVLSRLAAFGGPNLAAEAEIREGRVALGGHHMFSGNPMRTSSGWIPLQADEEWRARLPTRQFLAVSALTWPMLRTYGYPLTRQRIARAVGGERHDELAKA